MEGAVAVVTVCRKGGAETPASCKAGRDNDCNGLAGAADPACKTALAGSLPPLKPPRRRVRRPPNLQRRASVAGVPHLLRRRFKTAG